LASIHGGGASPFCSIWAKTKLASAAAAAAAVHNNHARPARREKSLHFVWISFFSTSCGANSIHSLRGKKKTKWLTSTHPTKTLKGESIKTQGTPQQNINPFFTNPPSREIECRCNPNPERSFFGSLRKYRNKQPKKKRTQPREREEWGRIREQMLPENRDTETEREFCFFFWGWGLSQYLPTLNDEGTAAWSFSRRGTTWNTCSSLINSPHPQTQNFFKQKCWYTITNKKQTTPTQTDKFFIIRILIHKRKQHPQKAITTKTTPKHRHKKKKKRERERERERERVRESVCVCVFVFAADKGWWKKDVVIRMCDKMFAPLLSF
jgi:hypothetical protein